MKKANQRGSITLFVILAGLFFITFLTGMFILSAAKMQVQIESSKQTQNVYEQGGVNQIYETYFGDSVVPIYTQAQLEKMCSGEQVSIKEEGGKIYTFSSNAVYVLKNDINFEYAGIWQIPNYFGETGRIEGQGTKISIKDTSKPEEVYYYYTSDNNYATPVTKEGYAYTNLILQYDAINNTGNGHSSNAKLWKDLSGNGNNGTLNSFADSGMWKTDKLEFDGVNDYITTSLAQASMGNKITIAAVCQANDIGNYRGLWGPHNGSTHGFLLQFIEGEIVARKSRMCYFGSWATV